MYCTFFACGDWWHVERRGLSLLLSFLARCRWPWCFATVFLHINTYYLAKCFVAEFIGPHVYIGDIAIFPVQQTLQILCKRGPTIPDMIKLLNFETQEFAIERDGKCDGQGN